MHKPDRPYATARTIAALMLREMSTRYGKTAGGFIWAVLEPLGLILILAVAFNLLLRAPALGTSFVLFYTTGYLPFILYQSDSVFVARALSFSKPLLFYPSVTWVDAIIARFILNTLTSLMVAYILLTGVLLFTDTQIVLDLRPIVEAMALAALVGLGVGVLNCALIGLIPLWDVIWSIISRPLFLASGILFVFEDLPRFVQSILWFNPLVHVIGIMRRGIYPMYNADYASPTYVIFFALLTMVPGLLLLQRFHAKILNEN
ncbi:ABC transporter permease [Loktanella sp. R86503]|uniref:ABC transporter permease n=1 Tax=Loktanella sp. R86503 TaxID=3093847 RepID=UPI0036DB0596